MIASPIVTVVSKPAARKLAISRTGMRSAERDQHDRDQDRPEGRRDRERDKVLHVQARLWQSDRMSAVHSLAPAGRASAPVGGSLMAEPSTAAGRARARVAALQLRAERMAERARLERSRHSSLDALFEMVDRDSEVGGGIMAGALAYRLFIWLLPLALVRSRDSGVVSSAESSSPESAGEVDGPDRSRLELGRERGRQLRSLVCAPGRDPDPALRHAQRSAHADRGAPARVDRSARARAATDGQGDRSGCSGILLAMLGVSVVAAAARRTSGPLGVLATLAPRCRTRPSGSCSRASSAP